MSPARGASGGGADPGTRAAVRAAAPDAAGGDPELAGLTEHAWRRVLGFAARAAAVTCARAGAEPPFAHELRGLA
ncbi:hypothetical protein H5I60_25955 [Streptomyces griseolus]|nr:hypothetical protein [Streptomyces griseolus]